ncbi:hypothetical protein RV06_GL001614 [Enterococcus haemoperoxidus]|nr:hypothetical protein RV06_GL001614 [Enterococcus haemoperoxidus]
MVALSAINGKWKLPIIEELFKETKRNGELMRSLEGITQRVLVNNLKELEDDGIINRKSYHEVPPRVEYTLSKKGIELYSSLISLCEWGKKFEEEKKSIEF